MTVWKKKLRYKKGGGGGGEVKVMMFYGRVNFQQQSNGKAAWPWLL